MSLERLIEGLADAGVDFVVVGMVAGQLYGSRVATYDLDVVYDTGDDNVSRICDYLFGLDPYVKETWPNEGVASDFTRAALTSERSLTVGTSEGEIDLLHRIDGIGDYANALSQSVSFRLKNGKDVHVLTLAALIAAKRASNREKDRLHIVELETIRRNSKETSTRNLAQTSMLELPGGALRQAQGDWGFDDRSRALRRA